VLSGPASVEAVDLAAVDDQAVARQLGGEGPLLWVEADFGLLVVEPLADQGELCLIDGFFGAEQQPVPVRAARPRLSHRQAIPFRRCRD
jgi:hypothetical protein